MASEQVVRRDTVAIAEEKEPVIEITTVPGGASYMSFQTRHVEESERRYDEQETATKDSPEYESLADKVKEMDVGQLETKASTGDIKGSHRYEESEESMKKPESHAEKVKAMDIGGEQEVGTGESMGQEESQLTLEEISKLRALAQQNSMEILKAAEEKYNQAKEKAATSAQVTEEFAAEKGSQAAQTAAEAKDKVAEGVQVTKEYAAEKGSQVSQKATEEKDKVAEGAQIAKEYAAEKGSQSAQKAAEAKDKVVGSTYSTGHYVEGKGASAKDTVLEKGQQGLAIVKDSVMSAAATTKDYTVPKVEAVKDKTVEATKGVVGYAGGKVAHAKDYTMEKAGETTEKTVETGKHAAEYVGKVTADMKEKAVMVGWEAAHYTTEKAVEGTTVAVGVVQGVAEKAGETVMEVGHKAAEIAAKPFVAAKDMTAVTAEKAKEYMAQKKEEAEREYEAEKRPETQQTADRTGGQGDTVEHNQAKESTGGAQKAGETDQGHPDNTAGSLSELEMDQKGVGVLGAIGETLVGIAETTKQIVIGEDDPVEGEENRTPPPSSAGTGLGIEEH